MTIEVNDAMHWRVNQAVHTFIQVNAYIVYMSCYVVGASLTYAAFYTRPEYIYEEN